MLATLKLVLAFTVGLYFSGISTWLPEDFQRSVRPIVDPVVEPPVNAINRLPDEFRPFSVGPPDRLYAVQRLLTRCSHRLRHEALTERRQYSRRTVVSEARKHAMTQGPPQVCILLW